ncbi:MAG: imidazole glycerol phosphate synthase subunit HisH [Candidatus Dormibacteria bacterium]
MSAPRIGICDYGVGNVRSVQRALEAGGADACVTHDARTLAASDGVVLPGVGAFTPAMRRLRESGIAAVIKDLVAAGTPVLGVCLGHQLLFDRSDEGAGGDGLGVIAGVVGRIDANGRKVPHIGWNTLRIARRARMLEGIREGAWMYFVHSYTGAPADSHDVVATTDYGSSIVAVVQRGSAVGTQFHPEKSGRDGLRVYANFVARCATRATTLARGA